MSASMPALQDGIRLLMDNASEGIAIVQDGVMKLVNPALLKRMGYSEHELTSGPFLAFIHPDDRQMVAEQHLRRLKGEEVSSAYRLRTIDSHANPRWVEVKTLVIEWDGRPAVLAFLTDITDRKRTREELNALINVFKIATEGISIMDLDGMIVDANEAALKFYGEKDKRDVAGKNILDFIAPEQKERALASMQGALESGYVPETEYEIVIPGGGKVAVAVSGTLVRDDSGHPEAFIALFRDITERRRAAATLRESERRYRLLAENVSDVIWVTDMNLRPTYVSPSYARLTGYSQEEALARSAAEALTPASLELARETFVRALAAEQEEEKDLVPNFPPVELEMIRKDGTTIWVASRVDFIRDADGRPIEVMGVLHDITERRKAEQRLRESEEKYRFLSEKMNDVVWTADLSFRLTYISPSVEKMIGFTPEERLSQGPTLQMTSESLAHLQDLLLHHLELEREPTSDPDRTVRIELEYYHKNGTTVWAENLVSGIRDSNGMLVGFHGVARDVSERRRSQEALEAREEYFRTIIEKSSDVVAIVDANGTAQYLSPNCRSVCGRDPTGGSGRDILNYLHPDDAAAVGDAFKRLLDEPRGSAALEVRSQQEDRSWRVFDVKARNLLDHPAVRGIVVNFRDVTQRKKAEQALAMSEERNHLLIDNANEAIMVIQDGVFRFANPRFAEVSGYTIDEILFKPFVEFVHPDDLTTVAEYYASRLKGEQVPHMYEFRFLDKQGLTRWAEINAVRTEWQGRPATMALLSDITERKKAEAALKDSETKYKCLFENSQIAIAVISGETSLVLLANKAAARMFGFASPDHAVGVDVMEYLRPEDREWVAAGMAPVLADYNRREIHELPVMTNDGRWIWVCGTVVQTEYQGKPAILTSLLDITDRRHAEEKLREAKEYAEDIIKAANVLIVVLDAEGKVTLLNKAGEEITGYQQSEVLGKNWFELIVPKERYPYVWEEFTKLKTRAAIVDTFENPILTKCGEERIISWKNSPLVHNNTSTGALAFGVDITERRRAEDLFEIVATKSLVGIYIVSDRKFQFINPQTEVHFGYGPDEILGMGPLQLVVPEDKNKVRENAIRMLKGESSAPYEYRIVTKSGEVRWITETVASIRYQGRRAVLGNFMDTTEQHAVKQSLEESLEKLQRTIEGTVQAITLTVESRDPFTAGHQRRVAQLAGAMAQEMGFSSEGVQGIRIAGLVHDIGKVCIPSEILCKPGRLTAMELSLIKTHCQVGYDILRTVQFPWPIADMVTQHHERIDGSGYPSGLREDEILMEARILGVADVVEAMTSHRPYRPAPGIQKALEEISHNSGRLYDSEAVYACLKLFNEKGFAFGDGGLGSELSSL